LVDGKVQATTTHFSWFTSLIASASGLVGEAKRIFDDATGGFVAESEQPSCAGEREARDRVSVTSTSGTTVKWCLGKEGNDLVLRVVNGRRYPLDASHAGLTITQYKKSYTNFATLARFGSGSTIQLFPREPVSFTVTDEGGTLRTEFGGTAYGLYQLQVGVETALAFLTRFGVGSKDTPIKIADALLMSEKCAGTIANPTGGSIIANCFTAKNILDAFGAKAIFLAPLLVVGPVIAFFEAAFSSAADLVSGRDRYSIVIRPVPRPTTTEAVLACPDIVFAPRSEDGAFKIRATGVSCASAEALVRQVRASHNFVSGPRSFTAGEYACTIVTDQTGLPLGNYTCTAGSRRITWSKT